MNLMDMAKSAASMFLGDKMNSTNVLSAISQLVEQNGGMSQMVEKFNSAGLGNVVQSWIGTGQNLPINAEQIAKVFGGGQIEQIAKNFNMNGTDLSKTLSGLLPQVVDKLTPNGQLTGESMNMNQILEIGKSLFANK